MTNLKLHRFSAQLVGIPLFIIVSTGVLLQIKAWCPWIQPPTKKGSTTTPLIDFHCMLNAIRQIPEVHTHEWKEIPSVDIRPSKGIARVRTQSGYEITLDLGTCQVLQVAPRRTSLLIELHEGSYFGDPIKYGIYLPTAILMLLLWATGIYLIVRRWWKQIKNQMTPCRFHTNGQL